jgi:hypothetical protein
MKKKMNTKEQKMPKWFNTAGLCFPEKHYMVDPVTRLKEVEELIGKEFYFTLHAPRQTGKTTYIHALTRKLNAGSQGRCVQMCKKAGCKGEDFCNC